MSYSEYSETFEYIPNKYSAFPTQTKTEIR